MLGFSDTDYLDICTREINEISSILQAYDIKITNTEFTYSAK
jgi:hypothetical protein